MTATIVTLTIGTTVQIDNAYAPDFGRTGVIVAVHYAQTNDPSYVVQPHGADYCRTYGAGELRGLGDFNTIQIAAILDSLVEVVDAARASEGVSASWLSALNTAYGWLLEQDVIMYDHLRHALFVASATTAGKFYISNGDCQCMAFTAGNGTCWHRAAARLVRRAMASNAEIQRAATQRIAASIAASRLRLAAERWAETEGLMSELYA